jgi:hypothetical protein
MTPEFTGADLEKVRVLERKCRHYVCLAIGFEMGQKLALYHALCQSFAHFSHFGCTIRWCCSSLFYFSPAALVSMFFLELIKGGGVILMPLIDSA